MIIPNLLIISGSGNKSGKTSIACRIIEQLRHLKVIGIKITPHFHETTDGLVTVVEEDGYSVFEETNLYIQKDSSRMLRAGAARVFFAKVNDDTIRDAFIEIMEHISCNTPVVCESPALRHFVEPGLFLIMIPGNDNKQKETDHYLRLPHIRFNLDYLSGNESLPLTFSNGRWISWHYGW
jgi:hypothetical protein